MKSFDIFEDALRLSMIRTLCPNCGSVDMTSEDIILTIFEGGEMGSYRFECPSCGERIEKPADPQIIALLTATDVVMEGLGIEVGQDWDAGFTQELSCGGVHKWDLPVKMGQRCMCGEKAWDKE